jgi:chemotaxis signal transduction protein
MSAPLTRSLTLGENHQQAFELLLDYDSRAQATSSGQQSREMQSTWFGLQVQLGDTPLLLPQQQLAEVLSPPVLTPIPGTPAWILGLANHYGRLLPVIDLYGFIFGRCWPDASSNRVIVTDTEPSVGLVVSKLSHSVRTTPPQAKDDRLEIDAALARWVSGQTQHLETATAVLELTPIIDAVTHWKRN